MSLKIAVVAFNYEQSLRAIREIVENDCSKIHRIIDKKRFEMKDGTIYCTFSHPDLVRGHCIDQLIIVDDCRKQVYKQQEELIWMVQYRMMHSCVPEEFQIQDYEYPIIEL